MNNFKLYAEYKLGFFPKISNQLQKDFLVAQYI